MSNEEKKMLERIEKKLDLLLGKKATGLSKEEISISSTQTPKYEDLEFEYSIREKYLK